MERQQHRFRRPQRALAMIGACAIGAAVVARTAAFAMPSKGEMQKAVAAAGVASMLLATATPAYAEEVDSMQDLEARLERRDAGLMKLEAEKASKKKTLMQTDLEKLERQELSDARQVEKTLLKRFAIEEKKAKDNANAQEKAQKVQINKEEKEAKAKIDEQLKKDISQIEAQEKAEIEAAKKAEQTEKQAAVNTARSARADATSEAARVAAAERAEAATITAVEKAERAIIAAKDKSLMKTKAALQKAEQAKVQASEAAEAAKEAAADQAEKARALAIERAELADREVIEQEEATERKVVEAVEAIEKSELFEENAALVKTRAIIVAVWSVVGPVVLPGIIMALYAFVASLGAPLPEPALGSEMDETRKKMGRKPRIVTRGATIDPWESTTAASKVTAGATTGAALMAILQATGTSTPGFVGGATLRGSQLSTRAATMPGARMLAPASTAQMPGAAPNSSAAVGAMVGGLAVAGYLRASRRAGRGAVQARKGVKVVSTEARTSATARQAVPMEVSEENPLRVVIAGGGVGGLLLAKALSKVPTVKVTLLEQTSKFARFGGPIQLASNALSVIREIDEQLFNDLMAKFTFTGCRKNGLVDALRTEWYCPFDAMSTAADFFSLPYTGVVDRPDLQDILLNSLPAGTLTNSKKVASYKILDDYQGVRVKCEDGSEHEGDVYVGADGIWSATRSQMWNEAAKGRGSGCTYSGYIVFAGEAVYQPEDYFDVGYKVYMGPKRYFVTSDVGSGRIQWYAFVSVAEGAAVPEDPAEKKEYIRSVYQGWSQQVIDLVDATPTNGIEDRSLYDRPPSLTKSWADGPVALLGDACHPMMPNLGQGGCQAMEDGFAIFERLKTATNRSQVPDMLQDYYRSRIVRASAIQGLSRIASDLLLSTFTFPWKPSEGLDAPYGKGNGDFNFDAVVVNYLKYLLPGIFNLQFTFLYSYHPYNWTKEEVKQLVDTVMTRHKVDATAAWEKRMQAVEDGTVSDEAAGPSFFTKVASTA